MSDPAESSYDVFISYADADRAWVDGYLLDALQAAGVRCHSESAFALGTPRLLEFERAVQASQRVLLVLSPAYLVDKFKQFDDTLAQSYGLETSTWPVVPLILRPVKLPPRLAMLTSLDASHSDRWPEAIERLCRELQRPVPGPARKPSCPYPGMLPFSTEDARFFYGREAEIERLLRLFRHHDYLFVIGPSGCGKSSLIFAGLIPQLCERQPGHWLVRSMRPGPDPLASLAVVLGGSTSGATLKAEACDELVESSLAKYPATQRLLLIVDQFEELFAQAAKTEQVSFVAILRALRKANRCALLLVMRADFYPDLMNSDLWPVDAGYRLEIAPLRGAALRQAIQQPAADANVHLDPVLLERLIADAADEPGALPLVQETMVLLWADMQRRLLPLSAYERLGGDGRSGLAVAIAEKADAVFADFSSEQQAIARRVFVRLVQFGEGRADTRRQLPVSALRAAGDNPDLFDQTLRCLTDNRLLTLAGEEGDADRQIDLAHEALINGWPRFQEWLAKRREAEQTRRRLEAKVDEWVFLGQEQSGLLDQVELREAENWLTSLDAAELGYDEALPELVLASRTALDDAEREKEKARQRELELERRRAETERKARIRQRNLTLGLGILFLLAVTVAGLAIYQTIEVSHQNRINTARRLSSEAARIAETQYDLALLLALEGAQRDANREVQSNLLDALRTKPQLLTYLRGHSDPVSKLVVSPDGKLLASASIDHSILLWDTDAKQLLGGLQRVHSDAVLSLAFSADSQLLASGGSDRQIVLWNVNTRQPLGRPFAPHPSSVVDLAFSPDGSLLAAASDQSIVLWDIQAHERVMEMRIEDKGTVQSLAFSPDGALLAEGFSDGEIVFWDVNTRFPSGKPLQGHQDAVITLAFTPDGHRLASGSADMSLRVWDIETRLPVGEPMPVENTDRVNSMAFSPDGNQLLSTSCAEVPTRSVCPLGEIMVWDVETRQLVKRLTGHSAEVTHAAFFPDGRRLATASSDTTIILWNLSRTPFLAQSFEGHSLTVNALAFRPDGRTLASASSDGTVRLWDMQGEKPAVTLDVVEKGNVKCVAFSPDGLLLASGDTDGTVRFWDGMTYAPAGEALKHEAPVDSITFSPDGALLASGSRDGQILIWQVNSREVAGEPLTEHIYPVHRLAFSPDGKLLVSASSGEKGPLGVGWKGRVLIWNVRSHEKIGEIRDTENRSAYSLAFHPDGQHLVLGFADGRFQLIDVDARQVSLQWQAHVLTASGLAFNRDGKLLASSSLDRAVTLWDTRSWQSIVSFVDHTGEVYAVAFSPSGDTVASGGSDWTVRLWDVGLARWQAQACATANRNLTRDEYAQYINADKNKYDRLYARNPTCSALPVELAPTPTPAD